MINIENVEKYMENNRIEAKRSLGGLPHSIWETYSAFANTLGGVILLGVEEYRDKTFHTVDLPNPEKLVEEFLSLLNDPKKVSKNILSREDVKIEQVGEHRIISITVPKGARHERPVYIDGSIYGGTYRRGGEGDYKCTKDEVDIMIRDAATDTGDMGQIEATVSSINLQSLEKYRKCLSDRDCSFYEAVKHGSEQENIKISNAILLTFGKVPEIKKHFPKFSLKYEENGTVIEQKNIIDFYFDVEDRLSALSKGNKSIASALREALANSLINADYHTGGKVYIKAEKGGILFSNSGGFRIDLERALQGGVSDPRNALIKSIFKAIGVGKSVGGGIPNIYSAWEREGYAPPNLTEHFSPDKIELYLSFSSEQKAKVEKITVKESYAYREIVVSFLTSNITAELRDVSDLLGIDVNSAEELLEDMVYDGIIEFSDNKVYKLKA